MVLTITQLSLRCRGPCAHHTYNHSVVFKIAVKEQAHRTDNHSVVYKMAVKEQAPTVQQQAPTVQLQEDLCRYIKASRYGGKDPIDELPAKIQKGIYLYYIKNCHVFSYSTGFDHCLLVYLLIQVIRIMGFLVLL